ncbi:hypothetical protein M7I_5676 [Glarea lozoyensis 74030]|uniref:Uncharacterized protein n=1 Tax=Glarea lozoyensis (strain ATCC 74030 / MF5533) TaxID=1104152 RepID=H0ESI7_GLAL7|nr:hypothetical protein M7I_5676 [Glarea lozoyensis 74030]
MVVFVDLDKESEPPEDIRSRLDWGIHGHNGIRGRYGVENVADIQPETIKPDVMERPCRTPIAEALGCYPSVIVHETWLAVVEDAEELFVEIALSKLLPKSSFGTATEEFAWHVLGFLSPPSSVVQSLKPIIDQKIQLHM